MKPDPVLLSESMKPDPVLLSEIKKAAGKTRSERVAFIQQCASFAGELGDAIKANNGLQQLKTIFNKAMLGYPRAVAACSLAVTISMRDGMSYPAQAWAHGILEAWNPSASQRLRGIIDDNLNPTRLEEYAGGFIRATTIN